MKSHSVTHWMRQDVRHYSIPPQQGEGPRKGLGLGGSTLVPREGIFQIQSDTKLVTAAYSMDAFV